MGLNAWKIANTCFSKPKLKKNKKLTMHGFFKEEQIEQGLSET